MGQCSDREKRVMADLWESYGFDLEERELEGESIQVDFDEIKASTELAVLVRVDKSEYWIPRGKIIDIERDTGSPFVSSGSLQIPEWLAEAKGL